LVVIAQMWLEGNTTVGRVWKLQASSPPPSMGVLSITAEEML